MPLLDAGNRSESSPFHHSTIPPFFERAAHAMLVIYAYIAWLLQDMIITLHAPSIGPENGVERSKSSADDGSLKQRINIFFVDQLYRSG